MTRYFVPPTAPDREVDHHVVAQNWIEVGVATGPQRSNLEPLLVAQVHATLAVADAITRQTEAIERLADVIERGSGS